MLKYWCRLPLEKISNPSWFSKPWVVGFSFKCRGMRFQIILIQPEKKKKITCKQTAWKCHHIFKDWKNLLHLKQRDIIKGNISSKQVLRKKKKTGLFFDGKIVHSRNNALFRFYVKSILILKIRVLVTKTQIIGILDDENKMISRSRVTRFLKHNVNR